MHSIILLAVTAPVAIATAADQYIFTQSELSQMASAPEVESVISRIEQAALANDGHALLELLAGIEQSKHWAPLSRAYLRYSTLMAFASVGESANARAELLTYLAGGQGAGSRKGHLTRPNPGPEISVWREDDGHRSSFVVFDPAAAARFALGNWNRLAWSRQALSDIAAGRHDFIGLWLEAQRDAGGGLAANGLVDALKSSSTAQLAALPAHLERLLVAGEPVGELARVVALRLDDQDLGQAIVRHADEANALAFLAEIHAFPPTSQLRLMELAAERHELGSAAMYGLGRLNTPEGQFALLKRLDSPHLGNSAAAALARTPDPALLQELAGVVKTHADPLARRRAVLSLHLVQDAESHALLRELARDPNMSTDLRDLITSKLP